MLGYSKTLANKWFGTAAGSNVLKTLMAGCFISYFGGTRPVSPEAAEGATPLVTLFSDTADGVNGTTGLTFGDASNGILPKNVSEKWSGIVAAGGGTATWFRIYDSSHITGADTSSCRIDGDCGDIGTEDIVLASAVLVAAEEEVLDVFKLSLPFVHS